MRPAIPVPAGYHRVLGHRGRVVPIPTRSTTRNAGLRVDLEGRRVQASTDLCSEWGETKRRVL
jgi:hypothetical protein